MTSNIYSSPEAIERWALPRVEMAGTRWSWRRGNQLDRTIGLMLDDVDFLFGLTDNDSNVPDLIDEPLLQGCKDTQDRLHGILPEGLVFIDDTDRVNGLYQNALAINHLYGTYRKARLNGFLLAVINDTIDPYQRARQGRLALNAGKLVCRVALLNQYFTLHPDVSSQEPHHWEVAFRSLDQDSSAREHVRAMVTALKR